VGSLIIGMVAHVCLEPFEANQFRNVPSFLIATIRHHPVGIVMLNRFGGKPVGDMCNAIRLLTLLVVVATTPYHLAL
jgi:hypothetical protein